MRVIRVVGMGCGEDGFAGEAIGEFFHMRKAGLEFHT